MNYKFKLNQTVYIILLLVFTFGVLLELTRSEYVLRYHPGTSEKAEVNVIPLPEKLKASLKQETYLVLNNSNSTDSMKLKDNILQTLRYMHKYGEEMNVTSFPKELKKYSGIIITFEELDLIPDLIALEDYVEHGGSVFFAIRPGINDGLFRLYRKLGLYEVGGFTEASGIELTSNILIKQKGLVINDDTIINSSLAIGLESRSKVHARSVNNIPLLWDVPYQKGRFIIFNGTMLDSKVNRGLIVGSLSLMKEDFIYPILNMKLANIDDFPAPVPEGYNQQIVQEHDMSTETFYRKIWWPFIQGGAKEFDVKYAGFLIQAYNDRVNGPFSADPGEQLETLISYGRELLKMGGEIGIHGYNHQSLTIDAQRVSHLGYNEWNSQDEMEEALEELHQYVKKAFPKIKVKSYVPPSNIIDEYGLNAIRSAIPEINVISSLYIEEEENERNFVQEFINDGEFTHLPRITSGYAYSNQTKWAIANSLTSIGVFSHFIHPDDILDEERTSAKTWGELSQEYNSMLRDLKINYPWLRSMLPSEAADWIERYSNVTIYTEKTDQKLRVYSDSFSEEAYFVFRTNKKITNMKDCTIKKIEDGVYLVTGHKEIFEIGLME
jgi:hypothetical protein